MTARLTRKIIPLALFALVVGVAPGCTKFSFTPLASGSQTAQLAATTASGLKVATANGTITVIRAGNAGVSTIGTIRAESQARLDNTRVLTTMGEDGIISVQVLWPEGKRQPREGADLTITLPESITTLSLVEITSSNGSVTLERLSGPTTIDTSNGEILVTSHEGEINARTSNAKVTVQRVNGPVTLKTSNGAIVAVDIAGTVNADSSNGDIKVTLADQATGPITLKTSNGSIDVTLSSAFAGMLSVDTSNGSITFPRERGGWRMRKGDTEGAIMSAAPGPESSARTSNGSITVRLAPEPQPAPSDQPR